MGSERLYELCKSCGTAAFKDATKCQKCGAKLERPLPERIAKPLVAGLGVLLVFGIVSSFSPNSPLGSTATRETPAARVSAEVSDAARLRVDVDWRKTGFDSIMEADFVVYNEESYAVKDIEVRCIHFAPSGTKIDNNTRTIYEIVQANSKREFKKVNMGFINTQVQSTSCHITKHAKL